ncbi:MAG: hypothetical protein ACOYL3_28880 [Desulfuromonadaceae bacterium]
MKKINKRIQNSTDVYFGELFDTYSKLNVIRLDLSYKKEIAENITTKEVKQDLNRLLNNRRHNQTVFGDCVGHLCKLEKGEDKGNHLHSMFFFDGHKIENDGYKASQIGKYWVDNITNGNGLHHSCNADKSKYKHVGVGMINHFDTEKRNILTNMVASYFAKEEQQVNSDTSAKERTFFKGIVTKQKSNAGRPRKEPES